MDSSKDRIHAAALALFARYGFDGVSLQMIADEVGLHKSSLFHHYRGKVELAHDVFNTTMQQIDEILAPLAADDPPDLATLIASTGALSDHFSEEPDAARLILAMVTAPDDSDLRLPYEAVDIHPVVNFYQVFGGWLDRAKRSGAIAPVNFRQTMVNLIGLVLFYPAVARDMPEVTGADPFSAKARRIRREELERTLRGTLEPS